MAFFKIDVRAPITSQGVPGDKSDHKPENDERGTAPSQPQPVWPNDEGKGKEVDQTQARHKEESEGKTTGEIPETAKLSLNLFRWFHALGFKQPISHKNKPTPDNDFSQQIH
jgi:hypothetical protein